MPKGDVLTPLVKSKEIRGRQGSLLLAEIFGRHWPLLTISDKRLAVLVAIKMAGGQRICEELDTLLDEHRCTYKGGKKIE